MYIAHIVSGRFPLYPYNLVLCLDEDDNFDEYILKMLFVNSYFKRSTFAYHVHTTQNRRQHLLQHKTEDTIFYNTIQIQIYLQHKAEDTISYNTIQIQNYLQHKAEDTISYNTIQIQTYLQHKTEDNIISNTQ